MTVRDVETQRNGIKCTIDMIPLRAGGGVGVGNNRFSNNNNENRHDESNRNSGSSGNNSGNNSGNGNGMKKNSNNRNHKINDISALSSSRVIISDYTYGSQQHISSHYQQQQQQQQNNNDTNNNSTLSSSTKKKIANGCSFFSLIGMLFMIFVGILMETQPFYIKGVTPNQIVYVDSSTSSNNRAAVLRSLGQWQDDDDDSMDNVTTTTTNNEWLSSVYNVIRSIQSSTIWQRYYHHRRIRIISSTAPSSTYSSPYSSTSYSSTTTQQQEEEERYLNNNDDNNNDDDDFEYETIQYQMQQEAKTAFKTAALYFLTMVLTYIYAQNHERITVAQSPDSMCDVDGIVNEGRGCCHRLSLALRAGLRRRKYSDIPDDDVLFQPARSSVSSSSSRGIFGDPLSSTSEVGNCERLPFLISGVTDGIDSFADEGVVGGAREARFRSLSLPSSDSSGITSSPRGAGREHQWADQYKSKRR